MDLFFTCVNLFLFMFAVVVAAACVMRLLTYKIMRGTFSMALRETIFPLLLSILWVIAALKTQ